MNIQTCLILCLTLLSGFAGTTAEARRDIPPSVPVTEVRSSSQTLAGSGDPADIYYPDPAGLASGYRFPIMVMLQGALVDKKYYSQFAQGVASHGFIVVVPNHGNLYADMNVVTNALAHMKLENINSESPLYGIVDTDTLAVGGHSFGGVAALLTINGDCIFFCDPDVGFTRPPELKAVIAYGSNSGIIDIQNEGIATAIIVGDMDTGQDKFWDTYNKLEWPRAMMQVHGANHFGLTDVSEPPGVYLDPDEEQQIIPQAITVTRFAYWSGQFLRAWLFYDWRAWWRVTGTNGDEFVTISTDSNTPRPRKHLRQ